MRINGEWLWYDDGVVRPAIDRTVLTAASLAQLGLRPITSDDGVSGLGGRAESVVVETQIRLSRETSSKVVFRGQYAAVTEIESLDTCVLGRDITGLFAVIVDQTRSVVCMLSQRHHYTIQVD